MRRVRQPGVPTKCIWVFAALLAPASGRCQSLEVGAPRPPELGGAATAPQVIAAPQQQPDGPLELSLEQAIRMAVQNNLDVQLEQVDQSVADFSLKRLRAVEQVAPSITTSRKSRR